MIGFWGRLWRGELGLARTFFLAHLLTWVVGMVCFNIFAQSTGMGTRSLVGTPLGILFVAYNVVALTGVIRAAMGKGQGILRYLACILSALLLLLSLWIPIYLYGKPLFVVG